MNTTTKQQGEAPGTAAQNAAGPTTAEGLGARAAAWLADHAPAFLESDASISPFAVMDADEEAAHITSAKAWQREKFDGGWAGLSIPKDFGGQGLTRAQESAFLEAEGHYHLPTHPLDITLGMVMPTLVHWAPERKEQIHDMLTGATIWCQLFSEPDAGSDLASLTTRAEQRDDGTWLINGQKVWTSFGHVAQYGYLLARANGVPGHAGITAFVVDMDQPGVDIHRLPQVTGFSTFNEVFLEDVVLPADSLIGQVGQGWKVAQTTLMNERLAVGADQVPYAQLHAEAVARGVLDVPAVRADLGEVLVRRRLLEQIRRHVYSSLVAGGDPGPESSAGKLYLGQSVTAATAAARRIAGLDGAAYNELSEFALATPGMRIAGGTDEIQKNIIADRILGLPREPRPSKSGSASAAAKHATEVKEK